MPTDMFPPRENPDHHDADLVIRLYELRRDPVMRESRSAVAREFLPRTVDDLLAVLRRDHPLNAAYRQTATYWEMVYSFARYGIVHPEFLMESNGEGIYLFAKVQPFLEELRRTRSTREFRNAEWVATNTELGRQLFATARERVARELGAAG